MPYQARIKPEYLIMHPDLSAGIWYDVMPIFPGLPERTLNMAGQRLTRLKTRRGFVTVLAEHTEVRKRAPRERVPKE